MSLLGRRLMSLKTTSARPPFGAAKIARDPAKRAAQGASIGWKRCASHDPVGSAAFAPDSDFAALRNSGWEADERPEPRSLGLLPSGPDPVGEWLVHRQPPGPYIGRGEGESKRTPQSMIAQSGSRFRKRSCCTKI